MGPWSTLGEMGLSVFPDHYYPQLGWHPEQRINIGWGSPRRGVRTLIYFMAQNQCFLSNHNETVYANLKISPYASLMSPFLFFFFNLYLNVSFWDDNDISSERLKCNAQETSPRGVLTSLQLPPLLILFICCKTRSLNLT